MIKMLFGQRVIEKYTGVYGCVVYIDDSKCEVIVDWDGERGRERVNVNTILKEENY